PMSMLGFPLASPGAWPRMRRSVHPLKLVATALGLLGQPGCGEVHFVVSPYTPQAVEIIYSQQEDVTVIRWRLGATDTAGTRFELIDPSNSGDGAYAAVDFAASYFPGGVAACRQSSGSCAQLVRPGHFVVADGARPVRAVRSDVGVITGEPASLRTENE